MLLMACFERSNRLGAMSSAFIEFDMSMQKYKSMPSRFTSSILEPVCRFAAPIMPNTMINKNNMNFILLLDLDTNGAKSSMNFVSANFWNCFLFITRIDT